MSAPASFVGRMVSVSNVGWSQGKSAYWVSWDQDGERKVKTFKTAHAAEQFAQWLDTTGGSVDDILAAEKALRELEEAEETEREGLRELGVPIASPRRQRKLGRKLRKLEGFLGTVHVRRHARFSK